jgi:hypothetical protein
MVFLIAFILVNCAAHRVLLARALSRTGVLQRHLCCSLVGGVFGLCVAAFISTYYLRVGNEGYLDLSIPVPPGASVCGNYFRRPGFVVADRLTDTIWFATSSSEIIPWFFLAYYAGFASLGSLVGLGASGWDCRERVAPAVNARETFLSEFPEDGPTSEMGSSASHQIRGGEDRLKQENPSGPEGGAWNS